jgi:hypothetical protein
LIRKSENNLLCAGFHARRQGKSGLGLSAQRKAVQVFADAEAFQIVSEYGHS